MPGESDGFLSDAAIAQQTGLQLSEVRDCIKSLDDQGYVLSARLIDGFKVQITAKGRLFLSQRRSFPKERENAPSESRGPTETASPDLSADGSPGTGSRTYLFFKANIRQMG
jgi:hypothetical protein